MTTGRILAIRRALWSPAFGTGWSYLDGRAALADLKVVDLIEAGAAAHSQLRWLNKHR